MSDDFKTYTYSYPFRGSRWCFELRARDAEEAEARLKAIAGWGKLDGEVHLSIYIPDPRTPASVFRRLLSRAREAYRRHAHKASP